MESAPIRPVRRPSSVVLLLAALTLPVAAGAQAAPQRSPDAAEAGPQAAAMAHPVGRPIVASPVTVATPTVAAAPATAVAAPFAAAAVAGVHTTGTRATTAPADALARAESVAPAALARRASSGLQHSQVLMIVGGAAVLLGLVTDGAASDLLLIGGAGVGLYGLYRYLQ